MKLLKFLFLTIITCGLYLVWLLLRSMFGKEAKAGGSCALCCYPPAFGDERVLRKAMSRIKIPESQIEHAMRRFHNYQAVEITSLSVDQCNRLRALANKGMLRTTDYYLDDERDAIWF